jgi:hypothetical protein
MATCPECDAEIEIDDDDLEEMEVGDPWECDACGSSLRRRSLEPIELEGDEDGDDEDDDDGTTKVGERRSRRRWRRRRRRGRRRGREGGVGRGASPPRRRPRRAAPPRRRRQRLRQVPSLVVAYSGRSTPRISPGLPRTTLGHRVLCVTANGRPSRRRAGPAGRDALARLVAAAASCGGISYLTPIAAITAHELFTELASLADARGFTAVADAAAPNDRATIARRRAARELASSARLMMPD